MTQPIPIISVPCELCGGHSKRKVWCCLCDKRFHVACFEQHECDQGMVDEQKILNNGKPPKLFFPDGY